VVDEGGGMIETEPFDLSVTLTEFNWCEHCSGDTSGMIGRFICIDTGCNYCLYCSLSNGDLTEKEVKMLEKMEREIYAAWLEAELERVRKAL
jgi:hypothetical protein